MSINVKQIEVKYFNAMSFLLVTVVLVCFGFRYILHFHFGERLPVQYSGIWKFYVKNQT